MLTVALQKCGADPSYCVGGQLVTTGLGADEGSGEVFVAEADESDGSFLMLAPEIAVVTNVEADHLDNYGDPRAVYDSFARFVERVGKAHGDLRRRPRLRRAGPDRPRARPEGASRTARPRTPTSGSAGSVPTASASRSTVDGPRARSGWPSPAATTRSTPPRPSPWRRSWACPFDEIRDGLAAFTGAKRRFEAKGEAGGVGGLRQLRPPPDRARRRPARGAGRGGVLLRARGRVIAVFQPHLYSRTRFFADEFGAALGPGRRGHRAGRLRRPRGPRAGRLRGAGGGQGAAPARAGGLRAGAGARSPPWWRGRARPGDIVLTMGAGDVTELGPQIVAELAAR